LTTTLRDIADQARVSISTVSRVLNGHPHVSEETRNLVLETAQLLGYPREKLRGRATDARSVVFTGVGPHATNLQNMQNREDVIHNETVQEFTNLVTAGGRSVLRERGLQVVQGDLTFGPGESAIQHCVADSSIVGVILLGGGIEEDFVKPLQDAGVPFVVAGGYIPSRKVDSVMADYRRGIEAAVDHLVARGRQRVALVNGPPTTVTSAEKMKGFRLAVALYDLPFGPEYVVEADYFSSQRGHNLTLQLLDQVPDLDAIIFADDLMAMGGIHALEESGRRVPEDVAVVGFHDYEIARFTRPPLTTIAFDMWGMGEVAARRLCMLLDQEDDLLWIVLMPTTLIVRGST
jgi:DNA-binding LacI/PurR family transcriptional regulator